MESIKIKLYVATKVNPNGTGNLTYGHFHLPAYLTFEELRKYNPEPIGYFIIDSTGNGTRIITR